uniref:Mediator of RNA polymerase II transcription subunit 22 n=1 Tax=Mesocestoides corti TaxID=53468 RepID=A0A5K3FM88_MESCO
MSIMENEKLLNLACSYFLHCSRAFIEEVKKLQARVEEADRRYEGLLNSGIPRGTHWRVPDEAKAEAPCAAMLTAKAVEVPFVFALKAASRAQRQIGKAMRAGQATKAAFTAANASRRTLKMATRSIIVVDVIFTAWEFASIIKDWNTRDPTQEDIDELIEKLQAKKDEAEEVMKYLQSDLSDTLAIGDDN